MTNWKSLKSINRLYRPGLSALLFTTVALMILELVLPIVTMQVYDRAMAFKAFGTLAGLLGLGLVAVAMELLIRHARTRLIAFSGFSMTHQLGQELVKSVLSRRTSEDNAETVGRNVQIMNSLGILREFDSGQATIVKLELAFVPVLLGVIALIAGWVALVPALLLIAFAGVVLHRSWNLLHSMEDRNRSDGDRYDYIIDVLGEIHSVKALALEQVLARDYELLKGRSTADGYDTSMRLLALFDVSALFSSLITLGTITAGAAAAVYNNITAGGLIACILLSGRVMRPVRRALALYARRQDYQMTCKDIDGMLATGAEGPTAKTPAEPRNSGELVVEDLSVCVGGRSLFERVNLRAKPGDIVHIAGPQKSGKSTLLRAMAGGVPPFCGAVSVGGADVGALSAWQRNRLIGYLPSHGTTYRGTIAENLTRFGESEFEAVLYVVRLLGFEKDIALLPGGMETRLEGNNADPIPPGLKQRIAFGRSLAPRPKLILFDSADAGLDRVAYEAVYKLFCRLKGVATIIMVTDDEYLKALANRSFTLDQGRLEEMPAVSAGAIPVRRYKEVRV